MTQSPPQLRRVLGVTDGIALLAGITIGVGIFSTPQLIATYQSSVWMILLLWSLAGLFAFVGGLIYAELGTRLPETGGEYVYIQKAFGPFAGFMFGWAQLFIIRTSPAAGLSLIAADYLGYFVEVSANGRIFIALGIIALLGAINYVGVGRASVFQKASTAIKLGGLFVLSAWGLSLLIGSGLFEGADPLPPMTAPPTSQLDPFANLSATMMLIVFSYLGWDRVGYVAGEMKNPKKVLPPSLFFGTGLVVLAYLSTNWLYHQTLGIEGVRESTLVASDTAVRLFGPSGAALVALLVIISSMGSTNGTMMSAPRVYYAMARDGLFFHWLDFVHPRFRTPSRAVIAHCLWAAVILVVRAGFEAIVAGMAFAVLIFYAMTTLALFKLRRLEMGEKDGYRVPFFPWLPGLYLVVILALVGLRLTFEFEKSLVDLAFILTGLPFAIYWVFWNRKRS